LPLSYWNVIYAYDIRIPKLRPMTVGDQEGAL
jgi:hypothetical protein